MNTHDRILQRYLIALFTSLMLAGCGGGGANVSGTDPNTTGTDQNVSDTDQNVSDTDQNVSDTDQDDTPDALSYKGLQFYYQNMPASDYRLDQLTDSEFDALDESRQLAVANKLLTTLFFGYPLKELKKKIGDGNFLSGIRSGLDTKITDKAWLENYILDDTVFWQYQSIYYKPQAITILTRFYAMKDLDKYFLQNWVAYILTQTIMFSPAYELSSTHTPNIAGVYNRLVTMLENDSGMRFVTYVHMMSEDNWRRFRSPEDNGREMMEIYLLDTNDTHVPLAGQALQNWKLNTDGDTLEVGLNRNTKPLSLFGTTVYNGDDFYRELVKSDAFTRGVTSRLVDFFFPQKSTAQKSAIIGSIVSSKPETWQDILFQIIFSEAYLLRNNRAQSTEETFYSLAKKIHYRHRRSNFYTLQRALEDMRQATMKYKLGKLKRVPLDTLSFAHYHKYIREQMLLRRANPDQDDPNSWDYQGWQDDFIGFDQFEQDTDSPADTLQHFVDYLFEATVARKASTAEQSLFRSHMIETKDGKQVFNYAFDMFVIYDDPEKQNEQREYRKRNIAIIVLDYISRLDMTYRQREVH